MRFVNGIILGAGLALGVILLFALIKLIDPAWHFLIK